MLLRYAGDVKYVRSFYVAKGIAQDDFMKGIMHWTLYNRSRLHLLNYMNVVG